MDNDGGVETFQGTTSNSLEVPDILEEQAFDLIIADLKMPGMDGLDMLRMIREKERFEQMVIITAFGSLESRRVDLKKHVHHVFAPLHEIVHGNAILGQGIHCSAD